MIFAHKIANFIYPFHKLLPKNIQVLIIKSTSTIHRSRSLNSNGSRARAEVALGGNNLVVVLTQIQTDLSPGIEVSARVDGTTGTLLLANRPVLVEGPGALNGGSIDTLYEH